MPIKTVLVPLVLVALGAGQSQAGTYAVAPAHSQIRFSVKKWSVLDVEGLFRRFQGQIRHDPAKVEDGFVEVVVEVKSVLTGEEKRDEALAMPEFFDAARFPLMTFTSNRVSAAAGGTLLVRGTLTIKGRDRDLAIRVRPLGIQEIPGEGRHATFATEFTLDRRDFGVLGGTLSRTMIGNEVTIRLTLGAKRVSD